MLSHIQNSKEYFAVIRRIEELKQKQLQPGTSEWDELEALQERIMLYGEKRAVLFMHEHEMTYSNELLIDFTAPS